MLCSVCKKEQAIIFVNEPTKEDPKHVTGYCFNCAKEKGINPLNSVLKDSNIDLNNVAEQFESIFNNISNNMDLQDMDFEEAENVVPIGAIIGNIFNPNSTEGQPNGKNSNNTKRVKVEKKPKEKKKKFLDLYGTNLTIKAKANELDAVIRKR